MKKRGVFLLLAVCAALLLFPASADELKLPSELKEIGEEAFMGDQGLDTVILPEQLSTIGARAFAGSSLKEIVLPDALTSIADDAFSGCVNLTVRASEGSYAYCWAVQNGYIQVEPAAPKDFEYSLNTSAHTASITKYIGSGGYVVIPDKIENCDVIRITWQAFAETAVTGVVVPETVKNIDGMAFSDCKSLVSVVLPSAMDSLGVWVFSNCEKLLSVRIPDGVQEIGDCLFYNCASLITVQVPDSVTRMGGWAFAGCRNLQNIRLPDGITFIGERAFSWCSNLEEVNVPAGMTAIPDLYVYQCSKLKQLEIPEGITSIGVSALSDCLSLTEVTLPSTVTQISNYAFIGDTALKSIRMPDSITSMGIYTFQRCTSLTEIELPSSITEVGDGLLDECTGLRKVTFRGDRIERIGENAFRYCRNLTQLDVPDTVTSIGNGAFRGSGVTDFTLPNRIQNIESGALGGFSGFLRFLGSAPNIAEDAFDSDSHVIVEYSSRQNGWNSVTGKRLGAGWIYWLDRDADTPGNDREPDNSEVLKPAVTNNEGKNEYQWGNDRGVLSSYLTPKADGTYIRVEYTGDSVVVEKYSRDLNLIWKKSITPELPKWGGYYAGTDYNFLVFGQSNLDANDEMEVMRVVRFTKNWHRVDFASVYGGFTKEPFRAGTLRMTQVGDFLYIHTCHWMYVDHQANMTYELHIPSMTFTHEDNMVGPYASYTSHSFNQFILSDSGNIIRLDHGDAYPRGLKMTIHSGTAGTPNSGTGRQILLMTFGGETGDNTTGATVGGFEASDTSYLVVGKSIDQSRFGQTSRQNLYCICVNKSNPEADIRFSWFTAFPDSDTHYVSTPQLVKISNTQFLMLWTEAETSYSSDKEVHYMFLNGQGMPVSQEYTAAGKLSDCQPIVSGNKVMWYVTNNSASVFYSIDLDNPGTLTIQ